MAKIAELVIGPVRDIGGAFRAIVAIAAKINEIIRALNTLLP